MFRLFRNPTLSVGFIFALFALFFAFPAYAALIDINTASHSELTTLTGIGDVKAQAIIDYRNTNGPFSAIEDIMNVSGIGTVTFENIKASITVNDVQSEPIEEEEVAQQEESAESNEVGSTNSGVVFIPDTKSISVTAGVDRTVIVAADSVFEAMVIGATGDLIENARVVWSFGNGDRKEGRSVLYHFAYPGKYVVVADASSSSYSASDRIVVTAVPASVVISEVANEYIALRNDSSVEVDLGGWLLFARGRQFQFPQHTIVVPGQEVLVSNKRTGLSGADPSTVALQYPNGIVAATYQYPLFIAERSAGSPAPATAGARQEGSNPSLSAPSEEPLAVSESLVTAPIVGAGGALGMWIWILGVLVLAGLGSGVVLFARHARQSYSIEEIS